MLASLLTPAPANARALVASKRIDQLAGGILPFFKYEVCGNDFVIVSELAAGVDLAALSRAVCERRTGVGADQFVCVHGVDDELTELQIFNPDGSRSPFCANATLAAGHFVTGGRPRSRTLHVGDLLIDYYGGGDGQAPSIALPRCELSPAAPQARVAGSLHEVQAHCGTHHYVVVMPDLAALLVDEVGPWLEAHAFGGGTTNVMFVQVTGPAQARVVPWERGGSGATLACGSGACCVANVLASLPAGSGDAGANVCHLDMPGGRLLISLQQEVCRLSGPARPVFSGRLGLDPIFTAYRQTGTLPRQPSSSAGIQPQSVIE